MEVQETSVQTDRVFTVPNVLSFLRLLGVPVFLWLVLVEEADTVAIILLAVSGFTDYLDGWLARRWNQISRVGQLLDPLADRLYILTTIVALTLRDIIPLWFAVLLVARDVYMAVIVALLKARRGLTGLPVHFLGKSATACLLYAFPLLLWGTPTAPWPCWPGSSAGHSYCGASPCTGGRRSSTRSRRAGY